MKDLPVIDYVFLSHNHYDHLDLPTLKRLSDTHRPLIYTGLGNRALLDQNEIEGGVDLDWWDTVELSDEVLMTIVPAQHFSGRGFCDRNATLWVGFVIRGPAGTVYFAGDTGFSGHLKELGGRFGPFRLTLLPIGTFAQADDGEFEPVEDLAAALQKTGYPHPRFWIMQNGESRDVPPVPAE